MATDTFKFHSSARLAALENAPLASFAQRAMAIVLDVICIAILTLVVVGAGAWMMTQLGLIPADAQTKIELSLANWHTVAISVAYFGLITYVFNGQTIGKRVMGIRVVSTLHEKLSLWHSIERALGYAASALEFGFGFAQYFIAENRQTTHDRIASTIVIKAR